MAKNVIKCPNCGAEYLPAEIYLPNHFLGRPFGIEKDHLSGKVINYEGKAVDTFETYNCDYCGISFSISAKIKFETKEIESTSFNKPYITKIQKNTFLLDEDK